MPENAPTLPQTDHDLLIRVDANLTNLTRHVAEITGSANKTLEDHEKRIRRLERWSWIAIGALVIFQIILQALFAVGFRSQASSCCTVSTPSPEQASGQ